MYLSKKIKKRISSIMALSMLGGFGLSIAPIINLSVASAQSITSDSNAPEDPYYVPIMEPKNITTITISPKNRAYLASNFPIQEVGTTKTFKTNKSSGTIKYTASRIVLTETVNGANPMFTYVSKLPFGLKKEELKCSFKQRPSCQNSGFGVGSSSGGDVDYGVADDITVDVIFLNSTKTQLILNIPNEYYNQQKLKINKAARDKKDRDRRSYKETV